MSELIDLITSSIGIDKSAVLREFVFLKNFFNIFGKILNLGLFSQRFYYSLSLCRIQFNIKKVNKKIEPIGNRIKPEWNKNSLFKNFLLPYYLLRAYGINYCIERFLELFRLDILCREKRFFKTQVRCWPNLNTIDLEENKKCTSMYYKNKIMLPFCYYNIIDSK